MARSRAWLLAAVAALWLHSDPATGARITAVRVGTHPGYTRVVLETDAPADFEVVTAPAATPGEVTLWIAAESRARDVAPAGPDAPTVALLPQADGSTLARIRAPGPLRVETQVLTAPPRLVVDLRPVPREAAAEAPAPPPPAPEIPPLPLPTVVETPTPTPPEVAMTPPAVEPAPVAAEAPEPTPPPEPAPVAPPTRIDAPPPVSSPPPQTATPMPPVAMPPPVGRSIDPRSLVVGLAAGIGLALIAFASRSRRAEVAAAAPVEAAEPAVHPEPGAPPEADAEAEPASPAEVRDASMLDVLRMHRRIDARLAEIADRLTDLAQRQARLEARTGAETEELASQRAAIARLQRSLRPAAPIRAPRQVP